MCELYLHSAPAPTRRHPGLAEFFSHAEPPWDNPDGWGAAFFSALDGDPDAQLFHEPVSATHSALARWVAAHPPESALVIGHIRKGSEGGVILANTQPLSRFSHGRRVVFAHNGSVADLRDTQEGRALAHRALGTADSEIALLRFLDWKGERTLAQCAADFPSYAREMAGFGPFNVILSDGSDTLAYSDRRKHAADGEDAGFRGPGLYLRRTEAGGLVLTSEPMMDGMEMEGVARGTTLHIRSADIVSRVEGEPAPVDKAA